jgi:hypothetical protein
VRRERSKNRSHVVEIKAFSCLPGASYPSLSDLAFQHRHTVLLLLLLLLPPLPCLGLDKKTTLAEHNNNTMMPTTKSLSLSLSATSFNLQIHKSIWIIRSSNHHHHHHHVCEWFAEEFQCAKL